MWIGNGGLVSDLKWNLVKYKKVCFCFKYDVFKYFWDIV